jgi:hypothetical protein
VTIPQSARRRRARPFSATARHAKLAFPTFDATYCLIQRAHALIRVTSTILAVLLFSPAALRAQTPASAKQSPHPPQTPSNLDCAQVPRKYWRNCKIPLQKAPQEGSLLEQPRKKVQTKRMLWIVPNFGAVSSNTELPPLSARGKFDLAFHDSFDYSSFTWTGIEAVQGLGLNSDPELGSGISGYGRYYWHLYVDGVSGTYFTEAIVPALTHEDPRYYTLGYGGIWHRAFYALSRTLLTKTDPGGTSFNWSEVGGNALEAALSNAYYPGQERTVSQTLQNWGVQMESAALNNIAKEFWPDIRQKLFKRN